MTVVALGIINGACSDLSAGHGTLGDFGEQRDLRSGATFAHDESCRRAGALDRLLY